MAAFSGINRPPEDLLRETLPEASQSYVISILAEEGIKTAGPGEVYFSAYIKGSDPSDNDATLFACIRFGPATLAYAAQDGRPPIGPMLLKEGADGAIVLMDLPELGSPQAFPEGAILRQDCVLRFRLPHDMPEETLIDWPVQALDAIAGRFGTLTTTEIGNLPNPRLSIRASGPQGDPAIQIRLMLGLMPYRPFYDPTLPVSVLYLRAATYQFDDPS